MAAMVLLLAPLSGWLVGKDIIRPTLVIASITIIAASLMLTRLATDTPYLYLFVAYFLFGIGLGLVNPPITNAAVTGMPPSQAGVAAALASTSRQVGSTLGVAVLGVIAGGTVSTSIGSSFAQSTHAAWWITAALGVVILAVAIATTGAWAKSTAKRTAQQLQPT
jgi:MFS family permease